MEPNVYDIDDSELTPNQLAGNWLTMGIAVGWILITLPFFGIILLVLKYTNKNVQIPTPSTKPSLP